MLTSFTAERVSERNQVDNYLIQRHLFAYEYAADHISGTVMEIGCGEGYGYPILNNRVEHYVGIDKQSVRKGTWDAAKSDFFRMRVPQLKNIPSNIFDFVISFQVIEHIDNDALFIREAQRVLKKGGTLILTTPNKLASFTRNPFHVREYEAVELYDRVKTCFTSVNLMGLNPSRDLKDYLAKHKQQVDRFLKWDILKLEKRLPKPLLRIPYNIFNQLNKIMISRRNGEQLNNITQHDFSLGEAGPQSLDLYVVAEK